MQLYTLCNNINININISKNKKTELMEMFVIKITTKKKGKQDEKQTMITFCV